MQRKRTSADGDDDAFTLPQDDASDIATASAATVAACNPSQSDSGMLLSGRTVNISSVLQLCRENKLVGYPPKKPSLSSLDHGWFYGSHREVIDVIVHERTACIVELGTWLGRSATYFAQKAPHAVIFTVDLWSNEFLLTDRHYTTSNQNIEILRGAPIYDQYIANTWDRRLQPKMVGDQEQYSGLVPMKMDSVEALLLLKSNGIAPEVIYVDANHHYQAVIRDIEGCLDAFPDAVLIGDDWDYKEVRDAVKVVALKYGKDLYVHGNKCWTFAGNECADRIKAGGERHSNNKDHNGVSSGKGKEGISSDSHISTDQSLASLLQRYKNKKSKLLA